MTLSSIRAKRRRLENIGTNSIPTGNHFAVLPVEVTDEEDTDFEAEAPGVESGSDSELEHGEGLHEEVSSPI